MKLKMNQEAIADCLESALLRVFRGKELSDSDRAAWVAANHDKIIEGMEDAIEGVCYRIENPVKPVTKPALEFKTGERNTIRLWVLDARERASLGEHHSFHFGGDETASLIYEEFGHGHQAIEHNLNNESTWKWIQEWMEKGMASEGLLTNKQGVSERALLEAVLEAAKVIDQRLERWRSSGIESGQKGRDSDFNVITANLANAIAKATLPVS